jgi:uncharacterized protein (DUF488 family)
MRLFTIGFTGTTAERFFTRLEVAGVKSVLDVRLNNTSQLAGFAKKNDLAYFLKTIAHIAYSHQPELAPTKELLDAYRKRKTSWAEYERGFLQLVTSRRIHQSLDPAQLADSCLLCSERDPTHCHRRLVAEYLERTWRDIEVIHL